MPLADLVAPNAVIASLKVNSKKQALQELAVKAAGLCGQNERVIFDILTQREKLGFPAVATKKASPAVASSPDLFSRVLHTLEFWR